MANFPDFRTFFRAMWGYDPFPWQVRLSEQVAAGSWPAWITLPTGTGKTSVIDVAVHHLAREAHHGNSVRRAAARIVFAVNRRIVVDEAFERASHLARQLSVALDDPGLPLHPVAVALQAFSGDSSGHPLEVFPLRGATFSNNSWARTPCQPVVLATTLDQLGSRLLFRGYGVSEHARPLHAALLANDALLFLDEAHTSRSFSQTLKAISDLRGRADESLPLPFSVVQLTATPPTDAADPFGLDGEDQTNAVIAARSSARKPVALVHVEGAVKADRHRKLAHEMADIATRMLQAGARRVLLVVNRVASAHALRDALKADKARRADGAAVEILTGRLRPLDRDDLIGRLVERHSLKDTEPPADVSPLLLVATQCIEVGADMDFDALVTELAPLDCLRQRFGRLNRYGRAIPAPAAVVAPEEALDAEKPDPVYGNCLPAVWAWLRSIGPSLDFGIDALAPRIPRGTDFEKLLAPQPDAPILLPPHLDLLSQTSPAPHAEPEVSLYIHGPRSDSADVGVVLRADIEDPVTAVAAIEAVPPLAAEAATVPLHVARAWLGAPIGAIEQGSDAPGEEVANRAIGPPQPAVAAYRFSGGQAIALANPVELAPGDILVVPSQTPHDVLAGLVAVGACSPWLLDQMERAHLLARDRLLLRLHPKLVASLPAECADTLPGLVPAAQTDATEDASFDEKAWTAAIKDLARHLATTLPKGHPMRRVWQVAAGIEQDRWRAAPHPLGGAILRNVGRTGTTPWPLEPDDLGRQDDGAERMVPLDEHGVGVARRAATNASRAGLPDHLAGALREAGLRHDLGKADPRMQAWLHGCSPLIVGRRPLVAKSGALRPPAVEGFLRAQALLPNGFRHELLSALILAQSMERGGHPPEADLLLHLVASHHGRCRAFAPVIADPLPEPFMVDAGTGCFLFEGADHPLAHLDDGVPSRFWSLTRRFGWWGLAYLEALLRLADQCESASPSGPQAHA